MKILTSLRKNEFKQGCIVGLLLLCSAFFHVYAEDAASAAPVVPDATETDVEEHVIADENLVPTAPIPLPEEIETEPQASNDSSLENQIQNLKKDLIDINRELFILEEELLFPASTQTSVFLSLNVGTFFTLDSVQLKLDDKVVAHHLYTAQERDALKRGGVQALFKGNLKTGEHELVAVFIGKGPEKRNYRRATSLVFEKTFEPKFIELKILDKESKQQPEFNIKEW